MTRNIEAMRLERAKDEAAIVAGMEDADDLASLFGSDEAEIGFSGRYGCFRIGCGGRRIQLDEIGG